MSNPQLPLILCPKGFVLNYGSVLPISKQKTTPIDCKFIAPTSSDKLLTSSDPEQLALSSFCSAGTMKTINGVLYGAIHSDCHFFVCSSIEFYPIKGFWFINLLLSLSKVSDACVFLQLHVDCLLWLLEDLRHRVLFYWR